MGATTRYGLRYPELDDPDDVPTDMLELATDVDAAIFGASIPKPVVNGQWIKGAGGAAVWSAITPADVGLPKITTSAIASGPPGSPANGDIWIAYDGSAFAFRWAFQYNAGSASAYKWEFIGGSPYYQINPAAQTLAQSSTWQNLMPSAFSVPRTGDYIVGGGAGITVGGGANVTMYYNVWVTSPSNYLTAASGLGVAANILNLNIPPYRSTGLAAGSSVATAGYGAAGSVYTGPVFTIVPVRIQ